MSEFSMFAEQGNSSRDWNAPWWPSSLWPFRSAPPRGPKKHLWKPHRVSWIILDISIGKWKLPFVNVKISVLIYQNVFWRLCWNGSGNSASSDCPWPATHLSCAFQAMDRTRNCGKPFETIRNPETALVFAEPWLFTRNDTETCQESLLLHCEALLPQVCGTRHVRLAVQMCPSISKRETKLINIYLCKIYVYIIYVYIIYVYIIYNM